MGAFWCNRLDAEEKTDNEEEIILVDNIWDVFEFKRSLGNGATADVALVTEKSTDKLRALKMVKKSKRNHFDRERNVLRSLQNCANIIRLHDAYEDKNFFYFTMEYCAGESLILRTAKRKKFTENVASKTATMILRAVKYIHDINIVHRDIKPENLVYLSEKDAALKMIDFGLAIEVDPIQKYSYRAGTPYFMAPEVIINDPSKRRSAVVCKSSDLWSVGICLYILLNGTAPFKGNNRNELFKAIVFSPLNFVNKDLSDDAKDLILKLVEKNPEKRINVSEALSHPWIMRGGEKDKHIDLETCAALKRFHTKNSLHRVLEQVAIKSMDEFDDRALKRMFDRYDRNRDGDITKAEFVSALQDQGFYREKAIQIAQEMLLRTDTNKDSMVQFDEFKVAMVRHQLTKDEYRMHAIFSTLDRNRDGHISVDELVLCLDNSNVELIKLIKLEFNEADVDKDGKLSFDEFTRLLTVNDKLKNSTMNALDCEREMNNTINDDKQFMEKL